MRIALGALCRSLTWYAVLFWTMTWLLGIDRAVAAIAAPALVVTGINIGIWRFYRGFHRRRGRTRQACLRGPVRGARALGAYCPAGHRACADPRCAGPGLSQIRSFEAALAGLPDPGSPLAGGIRLRYVPAEPLGAGGLADANLNAAVQYMRSRVAVSGSMTLRLYSNPPPRNASGNASGTGYTQGGPAQFPVRSVPVNQPLPHPAPCRCTACAYIRQPPVPGCTCPVCVSRRQYPQNPPLPAATSGCTCPSCTASRQQAASPYAPAARPKPRTGGGMDGFDGAELVAGTALGYRWWTMRAPQLHLNPAAAAQEWEPGLLRGVKDFWQPGVNRARCQAGIRVPHPYDQIPHPGCADGFWAYWEIQQHDMGAASSLPVVGVVRASGQVIMGPRGFRAQKAEIVALHLPFRIQPDLPGTWQPARPFSPSRPARRFTGRVINFPGAPPLPYSLGGQLPREPGPLPEPEPPTQEEIRAAADAAEAWEAVIADRLAVTYPGAEVCATLGLMMAKYPVRSEYTPPEPQVLDMASHLPCPYCGERIETGNIHKHVTEKHCP